MEGLSEQRKLFVKHYLICLTASGAAKAAGYCNPDVAGHRLIRNDKVQAAIQQEMDKRSRKLDITAEKVLQELAKIGFADIRNYCAWNHSGVEIKDSDSISDEHSGAIQEVVHHFSDGAGQTKVKLYDKISALEKIGKHLGMWKETPNLTLQLPDYSKVLELNGIKPRKTTKQKDKK